MSDELVKVRLSGPNNKVETLWARRMGGDQYQLDNIPWYAFGLSCYDIVEARSRAADDLPDFVRVIRKSGHRTVRLILNPPADASAASQAVLDGLRDLGCGYEGASSRFLAVDIPPAVDLMAVRQFLIASEQQWEHADPTYNDLFPADGYDA
jgi:hypothetical protein